MRNILIAGGSGLVGNRLSHLLQESGYRVSHLSRHSNPAAPFPTYAWNPDRNDMDERAIVQADCIVNLAGAGIADSRWTESRKKLIVESRVKSTHLLMQTWQRLGKKPEAYLSAAAIGYYGDRGETWLAESAPPGKSGFLVESCLAWENAIAEVAASGVRTAWFRIGIVLSTRGGALPKMMLPMHLNVGSFFGDGTQYYSWIHLDDLCRMFVLAIEDPGMQGPYNAVAPAPVRNREMAETLAAVLHKPALTLPVPAFALRLAMGEMADVVLSGARVSCEKILGHGFQFRFPDLKSALADLTQRNI